MIWVIGMHWICLSRLCQGYWVYFQLKSICDHYRQWPAACVTSGWVVTRTLSVNGRFVSNALSLLSSQNVIISFRHSSRHQTDRTGHGLCLRHGDYCQDLINCSASVNCEIIKKCLITFLTSIWRATPRRIPESNSSGTIKNHQNRTMMQWR